MRVATSDEYVSTPHAVQATEPVMVLYAPTPQGVHAVPSEPVYPAWHVQDVSRELPAADTVLLGHEVQVLDSVALSAVE
jgi:hypothetical protein